MSDAERILQEKLDIEVARVIEDLKKVYLVPGREIEFEGTVSGYMLATGIALAARGGAPRDVIERALAHQVEQAYGKRPAKWVSPSKKGRPS